MITQLKMMATTEKELRDGNTDTRLAAVERLAQSGDCGARELLWRALGDAEREVRRAAAEALAAQGQGLLATAVGKVLEGDWDVVEGLKQAPEEERTRLLRVFEQLLECRGDRRRWVIHALGRLGDRRAVPWLRPALEDADPLRQRAACLALGRLGDRQSVPALLQKVRSEDVHVAAYAAHALEDLGEERLVAAYRGVPEGEEQALREAQSLVAEGDRRLIPLLLSGLRRGGHRCRTLSTGLTLCALGVREAVPEVTALLEQVAGEALSTFALEEATETLIAAARTLARCPLPEAASAAVEMLGQPVYCPWAEDLADDLERCLHPAALPAVRRLLSEGPQWPEPSADARASVKAFACRLLARVGEREDLPALLGLLGERGGAEELGAAVADAIDAICRRDPEAEALLPRLPICHSPTRRTE